MPRKKLGKYSHKKQIGQINKAPQELSDTVLQQIIEDYYKNNLTAKPICAKYNITQSRFYRIINKYKDAGIALSAFDHREILQRAELPEIKRLEKLCTDATQVLEMSLAVARKRLENALRPGGKNDMDLDKITRFFAQAAPYIMERKDGGGKKGKEEKKTPRETALSMFKNQSKVG